jgi:pimeloyl-ACP methyl ester carboxylesterase
MLHTVQCAAFVYPAQRTKQQLVQMKPLLSHSAPQAIDAALAEYHNIHNKFPPRIVTVGHSLGGALATLAAAHIAIKHEQYRAVHADYTQRPLQTYTFAAPRVGDAALCSYFNSELGFTAVQVQNVQDPVPLCAPSEICLFVAASESDECQALCRLIGHTAAASCCQHEAQSLRHDEHEGSEAQARYPRFLCFSACELLWHNIFQVQVQSWKGAHDLEPNITLSAVF